MTTKLNEKLIQSIQKIGEKYLIDKIVLFGSRARADNNLTSDIDLAIFPLPEFSNRGNFVSELDEIRTLLKIDTVFIDQQSNFQLLENIQKEGVVLFERSDCKTQ